MNNDPKNDDQEKKIIENTTSVNLEVEEESASACQHEDNLKKTTEELESVKDRMLRMAAEFENYKKRAEKEKIDFLQYSNERLIREFLPILDNMLRAIEHGSNIENKKEMNEVIKGITLVKNQFFAVLEKSGVLPIEAEGKLFDPCVHEAIQIMESDSVPDGTVIKEVQKGFMYKNKLLRPSVVYVARRFEQTSPEIEIKIEEEPETIAESKSETSLN